MHKFILKIVVFSIVVGGCYLSLGFLADGYTDPFYLRFTSAKQKSLIIGTSRAAQGIVPEVLNSDLNSEKFNLPVFNYAFTILHSPYGEIYYNAIESKLNKNTTNGLFILALDPWGVSMRTNINYEIESRSELSKLTFYNMYPNYDYLRNAYGGSMITLLTNKFKKKKSLLLHKSGWLEVSVDTSKSSQIERANAKLETYELNYQNSKISENRFFWLRKTVTLLKEYGNVVFVRLPVSKEILNLEDKLCVNFDSIIKAEFKDVVYLNYRDLSTCYDYTDGVHLYKKSGIKISKKIALDINKNFTK